MITWRSAEKAILYVVVLVSVALATWLYANHKMVQREKAYDAAQVAQIVQMEAKENALNIGKTLPEGILVKDRGGKDVDLRGLIQGPTIVLKIAMDCQPCLRTLAWLRENAPTFEASQHVSIVVVAVRTKSLPKTLLPSDVQLLYAPDNLASGFLEGALTPAEFFFDGQGMLVARRSGYKADMESKLAFPHEASRG